MLYGRDAERSAITELLDSARGATGGVLVLRGPPGAGKSALLNDASAHATGMLVLHTTGVESEFELPFAAVHQLLRPALGPSVDFQSRRLRHSLRRSVRERAAKTIASSCQSPSWECSPSWPPDHRALHHRRCSLAR
jgi:predicted ATPase